MRAWQINSNDGIDALEQVQRPSPEPGPGEVRVQVPLACHAMEAGSHFGKLVVTF